MKRRIGRVEGVEWSGGTRTGGVVRGEGGLRVGAEAGRERKIDVVWYAVWVGWVDESELGTVRSVM